MAGAMKIYELSATTVGTDKTSGTVRFKDADNATVDSNNPLTIPSGTDQYNYSYTKFLRLYCATAPDTQIDNLRMYTDGANNFGTGIDVFATPLDPTSTTVTNGTNPFGGADVFTYTSGAPMDMDGYDSAAITATGFGGDLAKMQMRVASTANPGTLSAETVTFAYDEI